MIEGYKYDEELTTARQKVLQIQDELKKVIKILNKKINKTKVKYKE